MLNVSLFQYIFYFFAVLSLLASVLSLTLIAYDRFFGIVFAMRAHMTDKRASISLIFIWLVSFLVALPILLYRQQKSRQWLDHFEVWCDDTWPGKYDEDKIRIETTNSMKMRSAYFISVSVIMYFIPMLVMGIAYAVIIHKLWISTIPGELVDSRVQQQARTKKKVPLLQLICWCIHSLPIYIWRFFYCNETTIILRWKIKRGSSGPMPLTLGQLTHLK